LACLLIAGSARGAGDFATKVLAWDGAGGVIGYNATPGNALGPPSTAATPGVPDNSSLFSFGWGGYLTLGFDHPISDDPRHPGGYDFIVFGNSLYLGGDETSPHREPGYVEVGVDSTGQHSYGDGSKVVWYWLKGTPAPNSIAGFPIPLPSADSTVVGYADCTPTDGAGDPTYPDDPFTPGITPGSAGGDAFDLAWAVDASGAPAHLASVDFVRITCAVNVVIPPYGRLSTEVDAVSLAAPVVSGDVDGDGHVTIADAALTARAAAGLITLSERQQRLADLTQHGGIPTTGDVALILKRSAGL
jgi:hypothetical protein